MSLGPGESITGSRKILAIRGDGHVVRFAAYNPLAAPAKIPLSRRDDLDWPPRKSGPHLKGIRICKNTPACDLLEHCEYPVGGRTVQKRIAVVKGQEIARLKEGADLQTKRGIAVACVWRLPGNAVECFAGHNHSARQRSSV